jgi:hypothetical protein
VIHRQMRQLRSERNALTPKGDSSALTPKGDSSALTPKGDSRLGRKGEVLPQGSPHPKVSGIGQTAFATFNSLQYSSCER